MQIDNLKSIIKYGTVVEAEQILQNFIEEMHPNHSVKQVFNCLIKDAGIDDTIIHDVTVIIQYLPANDFRHAGVFWQQA